MTAAGGCCVWLTGLSGAGKSTIADRLASRIAARGRAITLLDGDIVRAHLSKGLGFSKEDRDVNVLRVGFVASEVARHGGISICALISPYEDARNRVRALFAPGAFILVHVATPLAVCEQRDVKGLYAKARSGALRGFTGVNDPYEAPADPDLVLTTLDCGADECAARIERFMEARGVLPRAERDGTPLLVSN